jgi:hypothetical protein
VNREVTADQEEDQLGKVHLVQVQEIRLQQLQRKDQMAVVQVILLTEELEVEVVQLQSVQKIVVIRVVMVEPEQQQAFQAQTQLTLAVVEQVVVCAVVMGLQLVLLEELVVQVVEEARIKVVQTHNQVQVLI